ncbi:50S ribosomal protein L10 [Candidatus Mycoplasma haematolamae str. Purdue]|uniref:Large ribosomal subunit protein uL10 n=1 Tax=Mycoplasma haematolamae (strain Purdue) TaxID=1212765 RepID=I7CF88_MYCHA|nr:50S ribosomal protein L10 [Candidatus Mycoplasma haematolamae]AFO51911.1 50S ribosomal protein L10 [Candidatus Mycoplasma haematolamae str. Purdue]
MSNTRKYHEIKEGQVNVLVQKMKESQSFLTVNYSSLGVKSVNYLRKEVKKSDGELRMVSNNVLRRALASFPESQQELDMKGQHFILLIKSDKIAPLKLLAELERKYEPLNVGSAFCENKFLTKEQKEYIHKWAEKDVAVAKLAFLMLHPVVSLIFVLKAIADKKN